MICAEHFVKVTREKPQKLIKIFLSTQIINVPSEIFRQRLQNLIDVFAPHTTMFYFFL